MNRRTPRVGLALLRLVDDETVVGDLLEEFEAGRGRWWLTAQALGAVALSAVRDVRAHPFLSGRGVVISIAILWSLLGVVDWIWDRWLAEAAFYAGYRMFGEVEFLAPMLWIKALTLCPIGFATGWVSSRVHPARHPGALMLTAVAVFCLDLPPIVRSLFEIVVFPHANLGWFVLKLMTGHALFAVVSLVAGWFTGSQRGGFRAAQA